jgi:hypothetical protein
MTQSILYVRAGLSGIPKAEFGKLFETLGSRFSAQEFIAPSFRGARLFWKKMTPAYLTTNAGGAISRMLLRHPGVIVSNHPSHAFAGTEGLRSILSLHDETKSCFWPISQIANSSDGMMLLWGCQIESPGFSSVHASQETLGLTRQHLIRYLYRWDIREGSGFRSMVASEAPGCSQSFDKFYAAYEKAGLLDTGSLLGKQFLLVRSIREAMKLEISLLKHNPRFVKCGRRVCLTCTFRLY